MKDPGPPVCVCFGVGTRTLQEAIARERLTSSDQVGARLKAGTGCGSCVPEIRVLLARHAAVP